MTNWSRWITSRDNKFFWQDETGDETECDTYAEAEYQLKEYCFWLNTGMTYYAAQMAHGV